MTRSSGIHAQSRDQDLAHHCGWEGSVEFWFDPEHDPSAIYAECPGCGAEIMEPI